MRVLILGATGMLGNTLFRAFQNNQNFETWGSLRNASLMDYFPPNLHARLIHSIDILDGDSLLKLFEMVKPNVVINCIGLIKQLACTNDPLVMLPVNSLLPHRLAKICGLTQSRLIHLSTDCVFSGKKGGYSECDHSDAEDLYGKSKFMGELNDLSYAVTIRTSMIGHELNRNYSLVNWFLSQSEQVKGYTRAVFSGLPTIEIARIISDYIIPNNALTGIYHVAAKPISKYDLLGLIAERYKKNISIIPTDSLIVDRSLNSERFNKATGFIAPEWPLLIDKLYQSRVYSNYSEHKGIV